MGLFDWFGGGKPPAPTDVASETRMPIMASDAGVLIPDMAALEQYMLDGKFGGGIVSKSGHLVTAETAMRVAAVYACVRIISGGVANMPLKIMRRAPDGTKTLADDTVIWRLMNVRPCKFMRAKQFRRMATAHVLLRGNFFALKVRSRVNNKLLELIPLLPDRVSVEMKTDMTVIYKYSRPTDGRITEYTQDDIFHLYSLTLNGFSGVTPIQYARETIGGALAMEDHTSTTYKNGARISGLFTTDKRLGSDGRESIQQALAEYRRNGARDGKDMVLEDGLTYERLSMTPQDMQYVEARKMNATDIFMLYGLPPHMASVVEKTTSYGNGVEEQNKGFIQWTLEDYLSMWEEAIDIDLIAPDNPLFSHHDRESLLMGTLKDQAEFYATMLQNRVMNPNEVRERRGMNRIEGGDEMLPTPTMSAQTPDQNNGGNDEPDQE